MVFKADYYHIQLSDRWIWWLAYPAAIIYAFFVEGVRASLMLASANDASNKNWGRFVLGFLGSIGMIVYDIYISLGIGQMWGQSVFTGMMIFLVVCGGLLEIRLCMLISGSTANATPANVKEMKDTDLIDEETKLLSQLASIEAEKKQRGI